MARIAVSLGVCAGALIMGNERADADPPKTLMLIAAGHAGAPVNVVSGSITQVVLAMRNGMPTVVTIEAPHMSCSMNFTTAQEATAVEQRILDAKTTTVKCFGVVVGNANNAQVIEPAAELFVLSSP